MTAFSEGLDKARILAAAKAAFSGSGTSATAILSASLSLKVSSHG
jgi:hypothetical protein